MISDFEMLLKIVNNPSANEDSAIISMRKLMKDYYDKLDDNQRYIYSNYLISNCSFISLDSKDEVIFKHMDISNHHREIISMMSISGFHNFAKYLIKTDNIDIIKYLLDLNDYDISKAVIENNVENLPIIVSVFYHLAQTSNNEELIGIICQLDIVKGFVRIERYLERKNMKIINETLK